MNDCGEGGEKRGNDCQGEVERDGEHGRDGEKSGNGERGRTRRSAKGRESGQGHSNPPQSGGRRGNRSDWSKEAASKSWIPHLIPCFMNTSTVSSESFSTPR